MLQRPEGATIAEAVEATGWQPHTGARGARRCAEEAAWGDDRLGEARRPRTGLQAGLIREETDRQGRSSAAPPVSGAKTCRGAALRIKRGRRSWRPAMDENSSSGRAERLAHTVEIVSAYSSNNAISGAE